MLNAADALNKALVMPEVRSRREAAGRIVAPRTPEDEIALTSRAEAAPSEVEKPVDDGLS